MANLKHHFSEKLNDEPSTNVLDTKLNGQNQSKKPKQFRLAHLCNYYSFFPIFGITVEHVCQKIPNTSGAHHGIMPLLCNVANNRIGI